MNNKSLIKEEDCSTNRFVLILAIIFCIRLIIPLLLKLDLFYDEAYYWYWSKFLDFGYYSKPPLIAWTIRLTTEIFGDTLIGIKIASNIFYSLTALVIYKLSLDLFKNKKIAFFAGTIYITLPSISLLSIVISTDAPLSFFWATSTYLVFKLNTTNHKKLAAFLLGICIGLGLLSKPTMVVFIFSIVTYITISSRKINKKRIELYLLSSILGFMIYMPNLIWNIKNQFIMFKHIKQISDIGEKRIFHPEKLLEFLAGQFAVFNPIFFFIFVKESFKLSNWKNPKLGFLLSFSIPFLGLISIQALLEKANINWALPTYITASVLVSYILLKENKKFTLKLGLIINIAIMIFLYFTPLILNSFGKKLPTSIDIYKRVKGWKQLSYLIEKEVKKYPSHKLSFDNRKIMAEYLYYTYHNNPNIINKSIFFNPAKKITNQFCINTDMNRFKGEDFILITKTPYKENYLKQFFKTCKFSKKITLEVNKNYHRTAYIYICEKFKGY